MNTNAFGFRCCVSGTVEKETPRASPVLLCSVRQIDITERGREVTLARWILRRVRVETVRVVKMALPSGGRVAKRGGNDVQAPKKVASWERVSAAIANEIQH